MKAARKRLHDLIDSLVQDTETEACQGFDDLRRLWRCYLRPHRAHLGLVVLAAVTSGGVHLCFPLITRYLADHVLLVQGHIEAAQLPMHKLRVFKYLGMAAATWFIFVASQWAQSRYALDVVRDLTHRLREDLYEKTQALHIGYYDKTPTGKILSRIMDDVNVIRASVTSNGVLLFSSLAQLIVALVIVFWLNSRLAFLLLISLPLYAVTFATLRPRIQRTSISLRRLNSRLYATATESVAAVQTIAAFSRERREHRNFAHGIFDQVRVGNALEDSSQLLGCIAGAISGAAAGLVVFGCALAVKAGQMSLGDMMAFYYAAVQLFGPVNSFTTLAMEAQTLQVVLRRVFRLLGEPSTTPSGAIPAVGQPTEITFQNVTFHYPGQTQPALCGIDLTIHPRERIALMGPSGSGKSSLFLLLLRFHDPQEGRVSVGEIDLRDTDIPSLRRHICLIQQEPSIFSGTLAENIVYGRPDAGPQQIMAACKQAELHDFIMQQPVKYETEVGEQGVTLSGGQRQRLALATALLTDPHVLLLDDTTSALDAPTEAKIRTTLNKVLENRSALIITQRIATARDCDRIVVIVKGRIAQQGTHSELVSQDGFYRDIYLQQETG